MGMGAVVVLAMCRKGKNLAEIVGDLPGFHFQHAIGFDTRGIDDVSAKIKFEELRKGGGVFALFVVIRNFACTQVQSGLKTVDQVDLPTPLWPLKTLILSFIRFLSSSRPFPSKAEVCRQG